VGVPELFIGVVISVVGVQAPPPPWVVSIDGRDFFRIASFLLRVGAASSVLSAFRFGLLLENDALMTEGRPVVISLSGRGKVPNTSGVAGVSCAAPESS
jgi:hypothetical protein